jgi:hypothetical protein
MNTPMRLPDDTAVEDVSKVQNRLHLVLHHAADGDAGPVGDDGGDRLLVDIGIDHPLFRLDRFQLGDDLPEFAARLVNSFAARRDLVARRLDFADGGLFGRPFFLKRLELVARAGNRVLYLFDAFFIGAADIALALEAGQLLLPRRDQHSRVLDSSGR